MRVTKWTYCSGRFLMRVTKWTYYDHYLHVYTGGGNQAILNQLSSAHSLRAKLRETELAIIHLFHRFNTQYQAFILNLSYLLKNKVLPDDLATLRGIFFLNQSLLRRLSVRGWRLGLVPLFSVAPTTPMSR